MRFLKKTIFAVAVLIVLTLIKILFAKSFPSQNAFYYNFFSCLQFFFLLWAFITGILEIFFWKNKTAKAAFIRSLLVYIGIIFIKEIFFLFLFFNPRFIPAKLLPSFRYYYENYQRDILQYNDKISIYDSSVFYKMKSASHFLFKNIEFSDSVFTNSLGFRSDETSVRNKKIICAGDSYTLGWGVQQHETYCDQLQNLINMPVLNTAMSSYGTAREIATVKKLDLTGAKYLIIQYSYNDFEENESYVRHHDSLIISPKNVYDTICDELSWSKKYFPGKCFFTISKIFLSSKLSALKLKFSKKNVQSTEPDHNNISAQYFLEVLKTSGIDFKKTQVIVFDICEYQQLNNGFINALEKRLMLPENSQFFNNNIHLLHVTDVLSPQDFYILDGHIRSTGQKKIALQIAHLIDSLK
jgi:hypothetical protein